MPRSPPPALDLRLLGPVEVRINGRVVALGAPKQRAVLAMLALQAGRTVSADHLAEGLWGEQPPASAPKMVQLYVSQLRRLLVEDGAQIVTHGRGYELRLGHGEVDVIRFEQMLEQDRAREALALWRGEALADVADEPFAAAEIRRLDELRVRAAELAIDADLASGRHDEVIGELEALIEQHPLRERLHAQRMLALYRCGRQAEALDAYRQARATLVDQIGVEPGGELQRLHQAILAQDPALDLPSPPEQATGAARPPPSRAAPVFAIAALLLFAGVVAFGVSRVLQPDSLPGIDENSVGLIDVDSHRITDQVSVGDGPEAVAAGAGSVWVANRLHGTVSRIDRDGGDFDVVTIDVGGEPTALAFGAGFLWVADGQGRNVLQIDPELSKVVERYEVGNAAHAVAVTSGAVWVASALDATVVRIDLESGDSKTIPVEARPTALAAGEGAIWVVSEATASVVRLDPRSGTPLGTIRVGNGPSDVAVGAGAVWTANRRDGSVSRIDPATEIPETRVVGREPLAVAAGGDGVWVADAGSASVLRLDADNLQVTDTVQVASSPTALTVFDGKVWTAALAATATHRGGTLRVSTTVPMTAGLSMIEPALWFPPATHVYDGLVGYRRAGGSAGGTLVGNLAGDVPEPSPDERTYVFRLRPDIRFSNGAPVTPEDVRASFERLLAMPQRVRDFLPDLPPIRGAARCRPRRCDLSAGIETDPAAGTVTIHLSRRDPDTLHKLHNVFVVPAGSPARPVRTRPLPGTGPYMIERWNPRRGGLLVRNPRFNVWSPEARPDGFPDEIAVRLDRPRAQVAAVERDAADIALLSPGTADLARLRMRHGARLHVDPAAITWYAFLNVRAPPFDDPQVRQALNYAVDRNRVAELMGNPETYEPTCQLLPPGLHGYAPTCPFTVSPNPAGTWISPDMATARRLVAASGTRGMKVEFWGIRDYAPLSRYFASLLSDLGYRATARTFDGLGELLDNAAADPQLGIWVWEASSAGRYSFLKALVSCAGEFNLSRFCDPQIDARMEQAAGARGPEAIELWRRVETSLAEQAPTVALVNVNNASLTAKRVGNYQHHPLLGPLLDQMWVR